MNRFILLACIIAPAFFWGSCKKDNTNTSVIQGDWELRSSQVSITPVKTFDPGNGNKLVFTENTYKAYTNGQLTKSGQYLLVRDTFAPCSVQEAQVGTRIVYDNDYSGTGVFVTLSGSKLTFYSGCFAVDGGSTQVYEKLTP